MAGEDSEPKTEKIHKKRVSTMGRRRFAKLLSTVGFGASTIPFLTTEDVKAAASDQVPIVYARAREVKGDPSTFQPQKKMVPADWYNNLQRAIQVKDKVNYIHWDGVVGVGVVPGDYGGKNAHVQVSLEDKKADKLRGHIPESIDGISLEIVTVSDGELLCNDSDTGDNVPGGVVCEAGDTDDGGSLTPRVYKDGKSYFGTARHVFGSSPDGELLYHPYSSDPAVGKVKNVHCYDDFVLCSKQNGHEPISEIKGASPSYVAGYFFKDGLSDLKAQGEPLHKIGYSSCHTKGQIQTVDGQTSHYGCYPKDGQVKWGEKTDAEGGDSGSMTYHPNPQSPDDSILVGSLVNYRIGDHNGVDDNVYGTAAYRLDNQHGYYF